MGVYQASSWVALVSTTGIILGAAYMLYLYRRVCYGDLTKPDVAAMQDLSVRELWLLAPIAAAVLWMGVYPESFIAPMRADVASLVTRMAHAKPAGDAQLKMGPPIKAAAHGEEAAHGAPAAHGGPEAHEAPATHEGDAK